MLCVFLCSSSLGVCFWGKCWTDLTLNESLIAGNTCLRGPNLQSTQNGAFRLQSLLQSATRGKVLLRFYSSKLKLTISLAGEPIETPDHHPERCLLHSPTGYTGVHVRRRGECVPGTVASISQDRRSPQSERPGRDTQFNKAGGLILVLNNKTKQKIHKTQQKKKQKQKTTIRNL